MSPSDSASAVSSKTEDDNADGSTSEPNSPELPSADSLCPVRQAVADAGLPLVAAATFEIKASLFSAATWEAAGAFEIAGGSKATSLAGPGDYYHDGTVLHVLSSTPLAIRTPAQTNQSIQIEPGVKADLTLAGVNILTGGSDNRPPINMVTNVYDIADNDGKADSAKRKATYAEEIRHQTQLHLTLADGTDNKLQNTSTAYSGAPGIRCGWGSCLIIDDEIRNQDTSGNIVTPNNGSVPSDLTLSNGTPLKADDSLSKMDSKNPGSLTAKSYYSSAAIGSGPKENAGTIIINGGIVNAEAMHDVANGNFANSAAIGAGYGGSGTRIVLNGGIIDAIAGTCGAAIGAGQCHSPNNAKDAVGYPDAIAIPQGDENSHTFSWIGPIKESSTGLSMKVGETSYHSVAGDIEVNGGFIQAHGTGHGNAFGQSCTHGPASNKNHVILITGGTLITEAPDNMGLATYEIGARRGYTIVTGGSVKVTDKSKFQGLGDTAYNTLGVKNWDDVKRIAGGDPNADLTSYHLPDTDKVFMVSINLTAEIQKRNKEAGITTDTALDDRINSWKLLVGGKEYDYGAPYQFTNGQLYLWLPESATQKEITVDLSYIDKNGDVQTIEPLFHDPAHGAEGNTLKRYVKFDIPANLAQNLTKYYDGTSLQGLTVSDTNRIPTDDGKELSKQENVSYKYQRYDKIGGRPLGVESTSAKEMPADAGVMKLTIDSDQWSNTTGFTENYWGHRATGWCEIKPIGSKIDLVSAKWEDDKPGSVMETAKQRLTVNATVRKADRDPDGNPTGAACAAPRGHIQLYVDGKKVGEPVKMVFKNDIDEKGVKIPDGDPRINAVAVPDGPGSYTTFQYVFVPAEKDFLVPDATGDNKHVVSVQYLPPEIDDPEPANYLGSTNPAEDPTAPKADVLIEPVDPETSVTGEPDPEAPEGAPEPKVEIGATPTPTDPSPEKHPTGDTIYSGDKTYTGRVETVYDEPSEGNPHPGRVILRIESESSGDISVVDDAGNPFTASIAPNGDGTWTVVLDPTRVGNGDLHIVQKPNGAFTGTHWDIAVVVKPNPKIPPKTSVSKSVENLTHPNGPTQPGDRLRYTIKAENAAKGSGWLGVMLTDALPAALELGASTVHLKNPSEKFDGALKAGSDGKLGEYGLSAPGADGRPVMTALAGDIGGVGDAVLTFECTVKADAASPQGTADISNTASATGSRPDPENPDGPPLPENPDPTGPVTPPGGGKVAPADPDVKISKSVENTTNPGSKMTKVGDVLRYTIELRNAGAASSCLLGAVISDPMPKGIEPVGGTMRMALPDGSSAAVPDGAYDKSSRTIAVTAGDLWGGQKVVLTFDAKVTEGNLGEDASNVAHAHGTIPSSEPGPGSQPTGEEPGKPAPVPGAGDEPVGSTPPVDPPIVVGDDPEGGDLSISKTAENKSRSDGTTHVGDKIRYVIELSNNGPSTSWMDTVIRDVVPRGLEPVAGSIKMTLPDGKKVKVTDDAYSPETRTLSVAAGHLYGGRTVTLVFTAKVTKDALNNDIGNTAMAYGLPPSKWDPEGAHPEPGTPFDPPEGWGTYASTHEQIDSPTAYPPGVTSDGGVIDDGAPDDGTNVIGGIRLAQTGDPAAPLAAGLASLAALAAAAMAVARRRIRRA